MHFSLKGRERHVPVLLPHFRLHKDLLSDCFTKKEVFELFAEEKSVLDWCDGHHTVQQIRHKKGASAEVLEGLLNARIVATIPPPTAGHRQARWLVISPHRDDAALSMGGTIAKCQAVANISVSNIAPNSRCIDYTGTNDQIRTPRQVTALRSREDRLALRILGATSIDGSFEDAGLRAEATGAGVVQAFIDEVHRAYCSVRPDRVFAPLGVGNHVDHKITCAAVLANYRRWRLVNPRLELFLYEDLPYAARNYADLLFRLRFIARSLELRSHCVGIDQALETKLGAISAYLSQGVFERHAEAIVLYAESIGRNTNRADPKQRHGPRERFWRVCALRPAHTTVKRSRCRYSRADFKITDTDIRCSPKTVPIIINSYNRLSCLLQLVDRLRTMSYENLFVIDNHSDFEPLLDYYRESKLRVFYLRKNMGHLALWRTGVAEHFKRGFYVYTDPDILPDERCPQDFMQYFHSLLERYPKIIKVGFGLRIDDLPRHFQHRHDVVEHESQFWRLPVQRNVFVAPIDTTFALYRPGSSGGWWLSALRTGGRYVARHLPWYADSRRPTEEDSWYRRTVTMPTHWTRHDLVQSVPGASTLVSSCR